MSGLYRRSGIFTFRYKVGSRLLRRVAGIEHARRRRAHDGSNSTGQRWQRQCDSIAGRNFSAPLIQAITFYRQTSPDIHTPRTRSRAAAVSIQPDTKCHGIRPGENCARPPDWGSSGFTACATPTSARWQNSACRCRYSAAQSVTCRMP